MSLLKLLVSEITKKKKKTRWITLNRSWEKNYRFLLETCLLMTTYLYTLNKLTPIIIVNRPNPFNQVNASWKYNTATYRKTTWNQNIKFNIISKLDLRRFNKNRDVNSVFNIKPYICRADTGKSNRPISKNLIDTNMVTASLTTPAIVTVTALVTETKTYSVSTCEKIEIQVLKRQIPEVKNTRSQRENKLLP
jgi:hypothetical protein